MSATKYRVTAPNREYSGVTGKCQFATGVYEGPVEDGTLMYFEQAGYAVENLDDAKDDETVDPSELKGAALDAALDEAGLPKTGSADEKPARLADHNDANGA